MNRGSPEGPAVRARLASRFNEAPIHESGKCGQHTSTRRPIRGFNEAPIHESGKCRLGRRGPP